jgi:cyclopropane fatty-acyl-phospholipid synthase-like methyltransferase
VQSSREERARKRDLVRRGYDAISLLYRPDDGSANPGSDESTANYHAWIAELGSLLVEGARVLDLGCGAGIPAARLLVDAGFLVTGVDVSEVQVARARTLVPESEFVVADMATWEPASGAFDAIVSLYALIHVPLEDQRALLRRMADWLTPGGYVLAIVGHVAWTGVDEYMGAPMFWDHADEASYLAWFQDAGFRVHWHRYVAEGATGHTLLLAQTPDVRAP